MATLCTVRLNRVSATRAVPARRASVVRVTRPSLRRSVITFATVPEVEKKVEAAIAEADKACAEGTKADCAVAWDTVEELSSAASHKKVDEAGNSDPLEKYCEANPETDECRVYED